MGRDLGAQFDGLRVGSVKEHCPVAGCPCSAGSGHPGFGAEALKAHIDAHLLNVLEGQVPQEWMTAKGWSVCPHCSKSASSNRRGGVHESCAAEARASEFGRRDNPVDVHGGVDRGGWSAQLRRLPDIGGNRVRSTIWS